MDDDLARRDFSINAIAVSLGEGTFGSLLDPFDGLRDLKGGVVRVLHSQSFVDDATRVLRALRYAHRLGFRLDGETQRLLERDLGRLDTISGDRLRHELERFFMEPRAAGLLRTAQDLGTLTAIHPSLSIDPAALARLETAAEEPTPESALRHLAFLVYAVPAESRPDVIGRLNMDRRWARVVGDVGSVRDAFQRLREPNLRPSEVFGLLRHLDVASIGGCSLAHGRSAGQKAPGALSEGAAPREAPLERQRSYRPGRARGPGGRRASGENPDGPTGGPAVHERGRREPGAAQPMTWRRLNAGESCLVRRPCVPLSLGKGEGEGNKSGGCDPLDSLY